MTAGRQLARTLELQSLNDLGFSKRYVRCLQVSIFPLPNLSLQVNYFGFSSSDFEAGQYGSFSGSRVFTYISSGVSALFCFPFSSFFVLMHLLVTDI